MHSISIPPINDVIYIMHRCRSFGSVLQFRSNQGQNSQGNIDDIDAWNLHPTAGKFIYLYAQRLQSWGNNKGTLTKCERGFTKGDLTKLKKKKEHSLWSGDALMFRLFFKRQGLNGGLGSVLVGQDREASKDGRTEAKSCKISQYPSMELTYGC